MDGHGQNCQESSLRTWQTSCASSIRVDSVQTPMSEGEFVVRHAPECAISYCQNGLKHAWVGRVPERRCAIVESALKRGWIFSE